MSAGVFLIDGYNLLHAAGMAQSEYRPGDLLRCRTRLLRYLLDRLTAAEVRHATVVFDARDPPPDRPARIVVSGLKVLFANPGGDADALIVSLLERHTAPQRVTLVSSDRALQRAARSTRSKFVGSDEFLNDLDRRRASRRKTPSASATHDDIKPGANLSPAQTAYWLNIFGDVPVTDSQVAERAVESAPATGAGAPTAELESKQKAPARRASRVPGHPRSRDASKPGPAAAQAELDYWLKEFGEAPAADNEPRPQELRISDLENWLREFQAGDVEAEGSRSVRRPAKPKEKKR